MILHDNLSSGEWLQSTFALKPAWDPVRADRVRYRQERDTHAGVPGERQPEWSYPGLEIEEGLVLPESNAIFFYLAEGTWFLPEDGYERAQVLHWIFFGMQGVSA